MLSRALPNPDASADRLIAFHTTARQFLRRRPTFLLELYAFFVVAVWVICIAIPGERWSLAPSVFGAMASIGEPVWIVSGLVVLALPTAAMVRRRSRLLDYGSVAAGLWCCFIAGALAWQSLLVPGAWTYGALALGCFSPLWVRAAGLVDDH